ncbi:HEAT repeat domain-containing protein [Gloeobacter kilaueensis]|uniref:Oxidoreductase/HEAT repeat-containing protein n=1 Tax=Gloeobacter kilaueensis (strain ATCC BAA-2537 / CCAP 1431/1 / ULC 316 / JS1) TaxID=1183438 RepID=U5QH36_GLOK1|nr:HEAT repeat domain-containing protein [Gloeobacter kilaueensis]AGY58203.1 oxidoreductase/HEAT repeat-containing protein [Gloeobacter kilaueensis JS1]
MAASIEELRQQLASDVASDRIAAALDLRFVRSAEAAALLRQAAQDAVPLVRVYAAVGLARQDLDQAFETLVILLKSDPDGSVRAEAAGSLGLLRDRQAFEPLVDAYENDGDWIVRYSAIVALGQLAEPRSFAVFSAALDSPIEMIRDGAIGALGELGDRRAVERLLPLVGHPEAEVRRRVAVALGKIGDPASQSALGFLAKDDDPKVAEAAQSAMQALERP